MCELINQISYLLNFYYTRKVKMYVHSMIRFVPPLFERKQLIKTFYPCKCVFTFVFFDLLSFLYRLAEAFKIKPRVTRQAKEKSADEHSYPRFTEGYG